MSKRTKSYRKSRRRRSKFGKSAKKIVKKMYRGAVKLGTFETKVHTYIGYFIGFLIGLLGLYFIFRKVRHSEKTTATVSTASCEQNADKKTYTCKFSLKYTANNTPYIVDNKTYTVDKAYATNNTLTIYYNKSDPSDISLTTESAKILGFILLLVAFFIIFLSWYQYYKVKKFKYFAASEGINSILNIFSKSNF
jgi:hypothetical protein